MMSMAGMCGAREGITIMQNKRCYHESMLKQVDEDGSPLDDCTCTECGVTLEDAWQHPDDIDPFVRITQQPYRENTVHCIKCQKFVKPYVFDGEVYCPNHKRDDQNNLFRTGIRFE